MSRRVFRPLVPLALLGLFLFSDFLVLQSNKFSRAQAAQDDSASCCGPEATTAPRELDFPYYSLRDGFASTLNLVSSSPNPIDLTIAIRSRTGQPVLAQTSIQPQQKLALDLRQTLVSLGADTSGAFAEGSVSVYFEGTIMPVVGQVTMTNAALKLVHESEMVENDPGRSDIPPVLNGIWWNLSGGRDASIMVSNMSADTATADVYLDYQGQRHTAAPLVFSAHETKVVSVTKLLSELGSSSSEAPEGGITILARGTTPTLIAQGRVLDPVTGFSTTLEFPDLARENASVLHAVGLPIGTPPKGSPYAGTGAFTPHVVVRNLLPNPQSVTITVEYPTGNYLVRGPGAEAEKRGKREFDGEAGEGTETLPLGPFSIAGFGTQDISLDATLGQLPLPVPYCSIRIQYSGAAGTMIAQVSSVDAAQDLVVDARVANEGDGWAGSGANPWHLDDQTESILFLTDESDKAARIGFSVSADDTRYDLTSLRLNPHETRAIDLRKLRDAQMADFRQNKIPVGATDGSVNWVRLDNVAVSGRVVVISRRGGIGSGYDCGTCYCPPGFTSTSVSVDTSPHVPPQTCQHTATASFVDCNQVNHPYDATDGATWSSSLTSVATVNTTGLVTGVSGGTTTISANYCDYKYKWNTTEHMCDEQPICHGGSTYCNFIQITGPDTVWWFDGQTPSAYNTTVTLNALPNGASYYGWSIVAGTDKAYLSGQSANTANVTSNSMSTTSGDVTVNVTVQTSTGTGIASKNITVRGAKKLLAGSKFFAPNSDFGYDTQIWYTIQDNFGGNMPSIATPFTEQWITNVDNSPYPTNNWGWPTAHGDTTYNSQFYDHITGPGLANNPPNVPTPVAPPTPPTPLSTTLVQQRGQEWRVGTATPGLGARVQTDTMQRFIDHGYHTGITSPAP